MNDDLGTSHFRSVRRSKANGRLGTATSSAAASAAAIECSVDVCGP